MWWGLQEENVKNLMSAQQLKTREVWMVLK